MKKRKFTQEEKELIIREYGSGLTSTFALAEKLGRTEGSIRDIIYRLGVAKRRVNLFKREEIEFLKEMVIDNIPLQFLYKSYVEKARSVGWIVRTKTSIESVLYNNKEFKGLRKRSGDYWSLNIISSALKCSPRAITLWFRDEEYKAILEPVTKDEEYYIHPKRLARFCRQFPGEIAKHQPDTLWLIDLLSNF
jgi:hypothetical protein